LKRDLNWRCCLFRFAIRVDAGAGTLGPISIPIPVFEATLLVSLYVTRVMKQKIKLGDVQKGVAGKGVALVVNSLRVQAITACNDAASAKSPR